MYTGNVTDEKTVLGLLGVSNSVSYKVHEIEKHLHNTSICYGQTAGGDEVEADSLLPFEVVAGAGSAFGVEKLITAGGVIGGGSATQKQDPDHIFVYTIDKADKLYIVQFYYGTGIFGAATLWSSFYFKGPTTGRSSSVQVCFPRIACNNKIWAKCKCETAGGKINILFRIHVYVA